MHYRIHPEWLLVGLGVLAAGLGVLPDPMGRVLGHPLSEAPGHLWMQWLLDRAIWEGKAWFGQEDIILRESLWVVPTDWLNRLLLAPLGWVFGRVLAYNIGVLGLLALAGLGTWRLARVSGADPWPAALAGLVVIGHPAILGYAADGRMDSLGIVWATLLGSSWVKLMAEERPSWRAGLPLGGWATAILLAGPNLTMAVALTAVIPSAVAVARRPARLHPLLAAVAVALPVAVMVVGLLFWVEGHDPARLEQHTDSPPTLLTAAIITDQNRFMTDFWVGAQALHRVPVASIWSLPEAVAGLNSTWNAAQMMTLQLYAPGGWWFLCLLPWAMMGLGLLRRSPGVGRWMLLAAVLQGLALGYGPSQTLPLTIGAHAYYIAPATILAAVPGLSIFNNYGLLGVLGSIAQGVGAALALQGLSPRPQLAVTLLLALVWGAEIELRSPTSWPLPTAAVRPPPALIAALATVPPEYGVLTLPLNQDVSKLLQTHHHHPRLMRFRARAQIPGRNPALSDADGTISAFTDHMAGLQRPLSHPEQKLAIAGVGAVILLPGLLPAELASGLRQRAAHALGEPDAEGEAFILYLIDTRNAPPFAPEPRPQRPEAGGCLPGAGCP